jgi:hypothetical protein
MGKKMDYGHLGIKMDRRRKKGLTRVGNKMDYGLNGMRMDRSLER